MHGINAKNIYTGHQNDRTLRYSYAKIFLMEIRRVGAMIMANRHMIKPSLFHLNSPSVTIVSIFIPKYQHTRENSSCTSSQIFIEHIIKTNRAEISNISKMNGIEKARITLV
jgi:hypothetical protein